MLKFEHVKMLCQKRASSIYRLFVTNLLKQLNYFSYRKKYWEFQFPYEKYSPICSQCTLSLPPENYRKPYGLFMFSGGREKGSLGTNGLTLKLQMPTKKLRILKKNLELKVTSLSMYDV